MNSRSLRNANTLVRLHKEGQALSTIGKGLTGALKGTHKVIMTGTGAAGEELGRSLGGGTLAKGLGWGVKQSPYAAAAYGAEQLAGQPVSKLTRQKLEEFRQRRAANMASYIPGQGFV